MKTKVLRYVGMGLLLGCFAYLLFSIAVSLRMNTGDFYFALPALTNDYNSELFATLVQIATFTWFGIACGVAYLFIDDINLEPVKQGIGYLVSLTVGIIPLAWTGHWYEHFFIGIFSYVIIIAVISLLMFLVRFIKLKRDIDEIKEAIGIGKEVHNEEI